MTVSVALTSSLPPACTVAPALGPPLMYARVPGTRSADSNSVWPLPLFQTKTMNEPLAPTLPVVAPADIAISRMSSVDVAVMLTSPPVFTSADLPMNARSSLFMTSTIRPTPTPAEPVVRLSAPATLVISVLSVTETVMSWSGSVEIGSASWFTCAPSAMYAYVRMSHTSTITEPLTAFDPVPAPPASATEVSDGSGMKLTGMSNVMGERVVVALTVMPLAASTYVTSEPLVPESM